MSEAANPITDGRTADDDVRMQHGLMLGWERLCRELGTVAYEVEHARVCAAWQDRKGFDHFWSRMREALRRAATACDVLPDDEHMEGRS